jgi:HlyD family secretion protein
VIWLTRILKGAVVVAVVGGVIYFMRFSPTSAVAHTVGLAPITEEVLGTGTLEARVSATISSKIAGRILEMHIDQGESVTAGQLLLTLEDEELSQQVAIAEAQVDASRAAMERLETDKKRAEAIADQAARSFDRVEKLLQQNAVSQEEGDKATEALAIAGSGVSLAAAAINEAQKELIAAEKNLEYQRARLADTRVTAPFDGLVVRRDREPGDVVVPGSQILSLISTNQLWISAWVDETAIARVALDQPARVVFRSLPGRSFPGKVVRIGKETDRETREFLVDVQVLELPANWAVGQRAEVFIQSAHNDQCVAVPADYVVLRESQAGVQLLRGGRAQWVPVQLGLRGRELLEVTSGLSAGDVVLRSSLANPAIADGRTVALP